MFAATPASAATVAMAISVTEDGGGAYTPTDEPGGDANGTNGIVRTRDSITYRVEVSSNAGASTNETFTVTAPANTSWVTPLPSQCSGAGSGVSGQVLTCNIGDLPSGQVTAVPVVLRVEGTAANGDAIQVTGTVTADDADNAPAPVSSPVTTVSAAARYDLSKNVTRIGAFPNTPGPDGTTDGIVLRYPIAVNWAPPVAGEGLLGAEQSTGTFAFTDDVSQMYGGDPSPAVLFPYNGLPACGQNQRGIFQGLPGGSGGNGTAVRDSGTFSCTQPGGPGTPIQVTITGTDTSFAGADGIPDRNASGGPIDGGVKPYVIVGYISIWIPQPTGTASFIARNTFTPLQTTTISGASNYAEPTVNNSVDRNVSNFLPGGGFKYLGQVNDAAPYNGVPGSAKQGDPYVTPGKQIRSQVNITNPGVQGYTSAIVCDTWDNRYAVISRWQGAASRPYAYSNGGWTGQRVEYAAGGFTDPAVGQKQTCDDVDGPWYSSPEDVPGGVAAVGKARVVGNLAGGLEGNIFTFLTVQPAPNNTRAIDFGHANFGTTGDGAWLHDGSNPSNGAGGFADSVIITQDKARITKKVIDPGTTAENTPDQTAFVTAGNTVDFALYPTLTNSTPGGSARQVTVTDDLPPYTRLVPDTASIEPASSEIIVGQDGQEQQRLTWTLNVVPNTVIPPITYTAEVSRLALPGPIDNVAAIASPGDVSPAALRDAIRGVQIVSTAGIGVEKTARAPIVVAGDALVWDLSYRNTDATPIRDVDVIDVLPWNGDRVVNRQSSFHGTTQLEAEVTADTSAGETVTYTVAPPEAVDIDGTDPSNQPGGSTTWCAAAAFGTAECPADLDDVTAFRIQRTGEVAVGATVSHQVTLSTTGALDGDQYTNRYGLRASNLSLPVQSNPATIQVVAGSVGDRVWSDDNRNGIQDDDEPGVAGVDVALGGTDDRGDTVTRTATTNADGRYTFSNLRPGTYTLTFTAPDGRVWTTESAGDDRSADSDVTEAGAAVVTLTSVEDADVALVSVTDDPDIDAGLLPAAGTPPGEDPGENGGTPPGGTGGTPTGGSGGGSSTGAAGSGITGDLAFTGGQFPSLMLGSGVLALLVGLVLFGAGRNRRRTP